MVDFHTHILPNIDDGATSMEDTVKLIKEAENAGFSTIICTSHYMEDYYEENVATRQALLQEVQEGLKEQNIDVELYLGNEIYISDNIANLLNEKKASTIANSNYVLFELPFNIKPMNLYEVVYSMLEQKLKPILAHPERYSYFQDDITAIYELVDKGVLLQSNYGSIVGKYGGKAKKTVKKLFKDDMVHFLGTDVHKPNSIYPQMPKILAKIEKKIGKEKLNIITTTNPKLVLENKKI